MTEQTTQLPPLVQQLFNYWDKTNLPHGQISDFEQEQLLTYREGYRHTWETAPQVWKDGELEWLQERQRTQTTGIEEIDQLTADQRNTMFGKLSGKDITFLWLLRGKGNFLTPATAFPKD